MSSRTDAIAEAFASSKKQAALMPYMMGGFPDHATSLEIGREYIRAGADLIELGVPFSDPLADGPAIQSAGEQALKAGATFESVLEQIADPLADGVPVVAMCYANPILARGVERAVEMLVAHRVAGLIVPDMPAREAGELREVCDGAGIDLVPLVAPTTPEDDVARIASTARGFVYVVSVVGVTGERTVFPPGLAEVVASVKRHTDVPVAVGFGVATAEQAAQVGEIADGVIIGSRLVRAIAETPDAQAGQREVQKVLEAMAKALRLGSANR